MFYIWLKVSLGGLSLLTQCEILPPEPPSRGLETFPHNLSGIEPTGGLSTSGLEHFHRFWSLQRDLAILDRGTDLPHLRFDCASRRCNHFFWLWRICSQCGGPAASRGGSRRETLSVRGDRSRKEKGRNLTPGAGQVVAGVGQEAGVTIQFDVPTFMTSCIETSADVGLSFA